MKTLEEIAQQLVTSPHAVTKSSNFWRVYEQYFWSVRNHPLRILEVGVYSGESLKILSRYFSGSKLLGVDLNLQPIDFTGFSNIEYKQCDQADSTGLSALAKKFAPNGLDIVIDDASHMGALSLVTFSTLYPLLKAGGLYVVEDWGTGYWDDWPDGSRYHPSSSRSFDRHLPKQIASHDFGMVGFLKHLVDLVGLSDIRPTRGSPQARESPVEFLHIYSGVAVLRKRHDIPDELLTGS